MKRASLPDLDLIQIVRVQANANMDVQFERARLRAERALKRYAERLDAEYRRRRLH